MPGSPHVPLASNDGQTDPASMVSGNATATPSRERTAELLEELADASKDAEMLKARIDDAERRALASTLRDPSRKKKKSA